MKMEEQQTVTVPDGWKLVPVEPTEDMLDAYWQQTGESKEMRSRTHAYMRRYYAAMLAVAPQPPMTGVEPVAWLYEWKPYSINNPWQTDISFKDPRVNPVRELRNVRPLYTTPPADLREENERDKLARSIYEAAVKLKICREDVVLDGPQLLMLLDDIAARATTAEQRLTVVEEEIKWLQNDLAGRTGTAKNALNDCSYWQKVATAAEAQVDQYKRELEEAICAHDLSTSQQIQAFCGMESRATAAEQRLVMVEEENKRLQTIVTQQQKDWMD